MAPYEADAQITYLVNRGYADFAVSEDSHLLAYHCKKVKHHSCILRTYCTVVRTLNEVFCKTVLYKSKVMCEHFLKILSSGLHFLVFGLEAPKVPPTRLQH